MYAYEYAGTTVAHNYGVRTPFTEINRNSTESNITNSFIIKFLLALNCLLAVFRIITGGALSDTCSITYIEERTDSKSNATLTELFS